MPILWARHRAVLAEDARQPDIDDGDSLGAEARDRHARQDRTPRRLTKPEKLYSEQKAFLENYKTLLKSKYAPASVGRETIGHRSCPRPTMT